jgi:hypothetical protein
MSQNDVELSGLGQHSAPEPTTECDIAGDRPSASPALLRPRHSRSSDSHESTRRASAAAAALSSHSVAPQEHALATQPSIEFDIRQRPLPFESPANRSVRRRHVRRRAASSASHQTRNTFRSRAEDAFRAVRHRASRTSTGSISSKTSSSTGSSLSWPNWRFWRNDSSDSEDDSDSGDYVFPPDPEYTLLLPNLNSPLASQGTVPNDQSIPHPYGQVGDAGSTPAQDTRSSQYRSFNLFASQTISPSLERLSEFLQQRKQLDGVEGDLSVGPGLNGGAAWWLDIMCPNLADMRALRKVRLLPT